MELEQIHPDGPAAALPYSPLDEVISDVITRRDSRLGPMPQHAPARPLVKLNGKAFDFDSAEPYYGTPAAQPMPEWMKELMKGLTVCFVGIVACYWWYYFGWHLMMAFFVKFLPWLINMTMNGYV